jgi:hypothetical protein
VAAAALDGLNVRNATVDVEVRNEKLKRAARVRR